MADQRERLRERVQQTEAMIRAIDAALAALDDGQGARQPDSAAANAPPAANV